jgi:hypothetical protein
MKGITLGLVLSSVGIASATTSRLGVKIGFSNKALSNEKAFVIQNVIDALLPNGQFSLPKPVEVYETV